MFVEKHLEVVLLFPVNVWQASSSLHYSIKFKIKTRQIWIEIKFLTLNFCTCIKFRFHSLARPARLYSVVL